MTVMIIDVAIIVHYNAVMAEKFRIALLIESSRAYGRQLLRGIASFGREQGNWTFFHEERSLGDRVPSRLKRWRPDGIIARLAGDKLIRQIRRFKIPVVDSYCDYDVEDIPGVVVNHEELIRISIEHFLERGFKTFAYCGFTKVPFSEQRKSHFVSQLAAKGYNAHVFHYPPLEDPQGLAAIESHAMQYADRLARWMKELPKPVAMLACNDMRGQQILTMCSEAGIAVPDEVSVLGVDNDDVQCELSNPPLSSIDPNTEAIGYTAAGLLQRLLDGQPPPSKRIKIRPLNIITRRSTDVLAIADQHVAHAVRFVDEHACDGMSMEAMTKSLHVSRSTIERWFKRTLGRSFHEEIIRVRINRAAELLITTHLTIAEIAHMTGFAHVESMSRIFKRNRGLAPGQYRLRFRRSIKIAF